LGTNIRVSNIEPGLAETEFSIVRFKGDKNRASQVYEGTEPLTGEDIAEMAWWLYSLPPHVNVNTLEVMPTCQAWGPFAFERK
jgi:NADP-dependent 3-hydroxy acid dehydrogenase YdfG